MPPEKTANALKGLKDLRARIVSQERERTRHRLPGSAPATTGDQELPAPVPISSGSVEPTDPSVPQVAGNALPADASLLKTELDSERDPEPVGMIPELKPSETPSIEAKSVTTHGESAPGVAEYSAPAQISDPAAIPSTSAQPMAEPWRATLLQHCRPGGWTAENLLPLLIEETLRARQPAIRQGTQLLASPDQCRFLRCPPGSAYALLRSDQGDFELHPKATSPRWSHWRRHYELLGYPAPDARQAARRRTLLELLDHLRTAADFRVGRWVKQVNPDDFLVVRQPHS